MRIIYIINSIIFCFFSLNQAKSQDFAGKVKNDSAFIEVNVSSFTGWEAISQQWGLPAEQLQQHNQALSTSSAGTSVVILVPVYHLLKSGECDGCAAVYHVVGKSEGLYRIGKWYGNQPVSVLKKRNNLRSDALWPGQKLLVGYIATNGKPTTVPNITASLEIKNDTVISLIEGSGEEEIKEIPRPLPPEKMLNYIGEGAFVGEFSPKGDTLVKKNGKASVFKSESGWADGRFYILNSNLKSGSVVKVSNPATGIFLYAKVVGPLPDIKQNNGLSLRLSSAAASMLGLWEEDKSFDITWEY